MANKILCNQLSFEDVFDMETGTLLETHNKGTQNLGKMITFPTGECSKPYDSKSEGQPSGTETVSVSVPETVIKQKAASLSQHTKTADAGQKSDAPCSENTDAISVKQKSGHGISKSMGKKTGTAEPAEHKTFAQRKEQRVNKRKENEKKKPSKKVEMPESVKSLAYQGDFAAWLKTLGYTGIAMICGKQYPQYMLIFYFEVSSYSSSQTLLTHVNKRPEKCLEINLGHAGENDNGDGDTIAIADENGHVWVSTIKIRKEGHEKLLHVYYKDHHGRQTQYQVMNSTACLTRDVFILKNNEIQVTAWKYLNKLIEVPQTIQDNETITEIYKRTNPYGYQWFISKKEISTDLPLIMAMACPYFEILNKSGFVFTRRLTVPGDMEYINRLCQDGKNLKEIFKTSKIVYTMLREEGNMNIWDIYRKMTKSGKISSDTVRIAYDRCYSIQHLNLINSILNRKYKGNNLFTWTSLIGYLDRLDQFEAISRDEALPILRDYLIMCEQIEMEPKIDGDSLKREHDIAARIAREKRNEELAKDMDCVCKSFEKYNWEKDGLFIRAVRSYDDLLDEAKQQHNCVAGYAQRIINGSSLIFFMRSKNTPNRSLITVELSPDRKQIRQKLMAYNRRIYNAEYSEFLDDWMVYLRTVK